MDAALFWNAILTLLVSFGGWMVRSVITDIKALEKQMFECQSQMNDKFIRRDDYHDDIIRIEGKLDKIFDLIEKKADK